MITNATSAERAIDMANPLRFRKVRLHADARSVDTTDVITGAGNWQNAFMSALGTTMFDGIVDWTFSTSTTAVAGDGATYCLALHSMNHADTAVQVLTALVLECNKVHGWYDNYEHAYGETMAATLCRDCVLVDKQFRIDYTDESKMGWSLVFQNIDTTAIYGVRTQLPATVEAWINPPALQEQA